jgi:phosphatidylglycerophosphate synthase
LTYWWLQALTATRLLVCAPVWFWCWWKRPRRMVLWMSLAFTWFLFTDHFDGQWARGYGLTSELGFWLDHLGDFAFYGVVVLSIVLGSRERDGPRRRRPTAPPSPPPPVDGPP